LVIAVAAEVKMELRLELIVVVVVAVVVVVEPFNDLLILKLSDNPGFFVKWPFEAVYVLLRVIGGHKVAYRKEHSYGRSLGLFEVSSRALPRVSTFIIIKSNGFYSLPLLKWG